MKSILHICTDFSPSTGGIEKFVLDLSRRQRAAGIDAVVLCLNRVGASTTELPRCAIVEGVPVTRIPFINLTFYKPCWLPLELVKKYEILHVHGIGAQLDCALAFKWWHRRPVVVSTHGGIFHTRRLAFIKKIWFFRIQRFVLRWADAIVASSLSDQALFVRVVPKVNVIENAVNVEPLLELDLFGKQRGVCLYVGRLSENKGVPNLLAAFAVARQLGADFQLRLVGPDPGGATGTCRSTAERLGIADRVVFVGEVSETDLIDEYRKADLFVSASRYEGFGLSAVEAKAAGCRLVLQNNDAFMANFGRDSSVVLTDYTQSDHSGRELATTLAHDRDPNLGNSRYSVERFSWASRLVAWNRLYEAVLTARARPASAPKAQ